MKSKDKPCILLIISSFQDQRPQYESVRHQHWKDMFVLLLLMKMIVWWPSASYFQFHSRQFVRLLAEEILSYSSAAMRVALAQSYLNITCHITYNTLSHVYYFNILGWVKFAYVVSTTRCIYTCPVSSGMRPRPPPEVVWAIGFISVSEGIYTCFFHDRIAIRSEKTHEVTRCKQALCGVSMFLWGAWLAVSDWQGSAGEWQDGCWEM